MTGDKTSASALNRILETVFAIASRRTCDFRRDFRDCRRGRGDMVEVPCSDPVDLALPTLTMFDGRPPHVRRHISVQPLFAEHRKEGREKCSGEANVEDGLEGSDYRTRGWECCFQGCC